jgi:aryl-alcohol dehydrogenase-like predicted oxidoreductase
MSQAAGDPVSLGLGLYTLSPSRGPFLTDALRRVEYLDTAPNYAYGCAEDLVADAISKHVRENQSRPLPSIGIKVRLSAETEIAAAERNDLEIIRQRVMYSREKVGSQSTPIAFIHNPESLFAADRQNARTRLRRVMQALQGLCDRGELSGYGIATYEGLFCYASVEELYALAPASSNTGSANSFCALQLPASIIHNLEVASALILGSGPLAEARRLGLRVFASQPFFHGGVREQVKPSLVRFLSHHSNPFRLSLDVVACSGLFDTIVVGTQNITHLDQLARWIREPALRQENYFEFLRSCVDRN